MSSTICLKHRSQSRGVDFTIDCFSIVLGFSIDFCFLGGSFSWWHLSINRIHLLLPVRFEKDPQLAPATQFVQQQGWPNICLDLAHILRRDKNTQSMKIAYCGVIIIPTSCWEAVITELNEGCPGVTWMKSLARIYVTASCGRESLRTFNTLLVSVRLCQLLYTTWRLDLLKPHTAERTSINRKTTMIRDLERGSLESEMMCLLRTVIKETSSYQVSFSRKLVLF